MVRRVNSSKPPKGPTRETQAQKNWRLACSLGHDDAILYLLGQAVRAAKLSMRQRGELAILSATRAMTLADAANSIAIRKRSKALRPTKGYWDEIFRARELAAQANLKARGHA